MGPELDLLDFVSSVSKHSRRSPPIDPMTKRSHPAIFTTVLQRLPGLIEATTLPTLSGLTRNRVPPHSRVSLSHQRISAALNLVS